jgi:hypothetical protein
MVSIPHFRFRNRCSLSILALLTAEHVCQDLTTAASRPFRLPIAHEVKFYRHRLKPLLIAPVVALTIHTPLINAFGVFPCSLLLEGSFPASRRTVRYLPMPCNARASEPHCSQLRFGKVDALVPLASSSYTPSESRLVDICVSLFSWKRPCALCTTGSSRVVHPRGPLGDRTFLREANLLLTLVHLAPAGPEVW